MLCVLRLATCESKGEQCQHANETDHVTQALELEEKCLWRYGTALVVEQLDRFIGH